MTETYFSKFPTIQYDDKVTRNITERVSILTKTPKRIPTQYYPYELNESLRSDILAGNYYQDATLDWLIWLTNGMTDPYYDWYLNTDDFGRYIIEKYGSIEYAQNLVLYYRNNWHDDPNHLTVAAFNALPAIQKRYYTPNFSGGNKIIDYQRAPVDWTASTNRILKLDLLSITGTFSNNEVLTIISGGTQVGAAQVVSQTNNTIFCQHISGNVNIGYDVSGWQSNATGTINTNNMISEVLANSEFVYYSPVYAYDIENERNEKNKFIFLLDANYALPTAEEIRKQLI